MTAQANQSGDLGSWLDVAARAVKAPGFDREGNLIFGGPDPEGPAPLPRLPGPCMPGSIRILTIIDLANIIGALERMATELNKPEVAYWLDLTGDALEHPGFDQGGMLVFRSSDVRRQPPFPRLPGGDCRPEDVDHLIMNVAELGQVLQELRKMV